MDEREAGAEEDADCIPHTSVPLAWTRVDRVIARRMRTQRKAAELEYLVKWQVRLPLDLSPRPQSDIQISNALGGHDAHVVQASMGELRGRALQAVSMSP